MGKRVICFTVDEEDYERIARRAREERLSIASYVRRVVVLRDRLR